MNKQKIGVLLVNLGTPSAPTSTAIRHYLKAFLSDPAVVSLWRPLWWLILNGFILPIRSQQLVKAYQHIWLPQGSPLAVYTAQQAHALQTLCDKNNKNIKVVFAMRYGKPSIQTGLDTLETYQPNRYLILPLYPQYSTTTTLSVFEEVKKIFQIGHTTPTHHFIPSFFDDEGYIAALAHHVQTYWQHHPREKKILFSFHGLPTALCKKGDPYEQQCYATATLLAEKLNLTSDEYCVVFQSRFGKQQWLQPYCVDTLKHLPKAGCKHIDLFCPGFVSDCLETLEEIAVTHKKIFFEAGGEQFNYIPALNNDSVFIEALYHLITKQKI